MECERLQGLVKAWYLQVQDESMAPARMVAFMEKHIGECPVCLNDPMVRQEVDKITAIVLPPTKVRKSEVDEEEIADEPEEEEDSSLADDDSPEEEEGEGDDGEEPLEDDEELDDEDDDDL